MSQENTSNGQNSQNDSSSQLPKVSIWNRNFTILTLGSIVSMVGANLSNYAASLYVLDQTESTFLYALFMVLAILPGIILPALCGPLLDKFSRRKTIYTLDFMSGTVYAFYAVMYFTGHLNYWIIAVGNLILGSIGSIYGVAYSSFYPLLVEKQNFSKAYAVTSTIESIVPFVMPLSLLMYNLVGLGFLYVINMASFIIAAIFELNIKYKEQYVKKQDEEFGIKQYFTTFRQGMEYLGQEKGLLAIVLYFTLMAVFGSALDVNLLPYFKNNISNGEVMYMYVWACFGIGRIVGGRLHYRYKLPASKKFLIAVIVYITTSIIDGSLLYMSFTSMYIFYFISGILSMTSYNIRIASTQSYVPDDRKGRFNGTFMMLSSLGAIIGKLASGALGEFMDIRYVISMFMLCNVISALVIMIPARKHVGKIYNMDI